MNLTTVSHEKTATTERTVVASSNLDLLREMAKRHRAARGHGVKIRTIIDLDGGRLEITKTYQK